jgi:predicted PurR-regulated permease PerM
VLPDHDYIFVNRDLSHLMDELYKPGEDLPAAPGEQPAGSGSRHVLGLLIAAAVLYVAKAVFMPIAIASILAVIASPVSTRLERYIGRILSAALIVALAIAFVAGSVYFFAIEVSSVANEVTQYSGNIAGKIRSLRAARPSWMGRFESMVQQLGGEIQSPGRPAPKRPQPQPATPGKSISEWISPVMPLIGGVFGGVFEAFMVMVLMFFLLYDRVGLRDRLVRLAVRARVNVASKALDTAGERVSRYLLYYSLINLFFGTAVGLICWGFGLERPELWGALAFFLRYVPYIGAITSGLLPTLVALAIFPGWLRPLGILISYTVLDQVIAQFIEPFVIGAGVGVSPIALLVSAIFWAWLWGPIGLVLSTPFTVCLYSVAGFLLDPAGRGCRARGLPRLLPQAAGNGRSRSPRSGHPLLRSAFDARDFHRRAAARDGTGRRGTGAGQHHPGQLRDDYGRDTRPGSGPGGAFCQAATGSAPAHTGTLPA